MPDPVKHSVIASTFADLADLRAFRKWFDIYKSQGMSDQQAELKAFAKGDNGIGCWGDNTAQEITPMCALPPETMVERWGSVKAAKHRIVHVVYKDHEADCILADRMPYLRNIKTSARIDLNPAAVKQLHIPNGGMVRVTWWWA